MKPLGCDLHANQHGESGKKYRGSNQVTQMHRHRHRVAARLTQGRCGNFDDPKDEGDLGDFTSEILSQTSHIASRFERFRQKDPRAKNAPRRSNL